MLAPRMRELVLRSFLLLSVTLFCFGCLGPVEGVYPPSAGQSPRIIHVASNGWHTAIVLNTDDLGPALRQRWARFLNYSHLEIGWGDEGYFRADQIDAGLALQASFFSRGSVIHLRGLFDDPATYFSSYDVALYRVELSPEGHARLQRFLTEAVKVDPSTHQAIDAGPGQDLDSRFLEARGRYSLLHTCNHWTADALRAAGLPITPVYSFDAGNLEFQLRQRVSRYQPHLVVRSRP